MFLTIDRGSKDDQESLQDVDTTHHTTKFESSSSSSLMNLKKETVNDHHETNVDEENEEEDAETVKVATVNLASTNGETILKKQRLEGTEVKCDKCTKVFYNLEFLALHKLNKHGSDSNSTNTPGGVQLPTTPQTSKLISSITNKENTAGSVRSRSSTSLNRPEQPNNVLQTQSFCEYCNKSFCNKYFLRTHMSKAHGKTLIIENNSNNTIINSLLNGAEGNTDSAASQSDEDFNINLNETYFASKVVDRVQCDICNKQVCNKYFLRTHKQKVHNI